MIFLLVNGQAEITEPEGNENFFTDAGVYILQMTRILFPGRADPAAKIFAIEGNPTPPN